MVKSAKSIIASLSVLLIFAGTLAAQNQLGRSPTSQILYKDIPLGEYPPVPQLFADSLFVLINNVSLSDSTKVHGLSAAFSSPILSFISIVDKNGKPITGLADTVRWLSIDDIANNGRRIGDIWQPVLEYHEENPAIPADPDVTHQTPGLLVTEVNAREPLQVNTVIAMDHSGSMRGSIETAKAAARTYVDHMRNGDQAAVIKFSNEVRVAQRFTRDRRMLIQAINRQPAGGRTLFYDALIKSVELIKEENNRRAVIAYTDGFDNGSTATVQAVIDSANTYGIPIFTIGVGDSVSKTILRDIAVSTGGIFLFAPTVNELDAIFLQLSTVINNYYVTAHTSTDPVRNNTWRIVDLTVNHDGENSRALGRYFIAARKQKYDLAVSQVSTTDSVGVLNGRPAKFAKPGESYFYQLHLMNVGKETLRDISLVNFFPDSVRVGGYSLRPAKENADSARWNFNVLQAGESVSINFRATVRSKMPVQLTALINNLQVSAERDSSLANNFSTDTVYAVSKGTPPPPRKRIDVAISQISTTDSISVINGDSLKIVKAGETYSYQLKISNVGDSTASDVRLTNIFPDSISASGFNVAPSSVNQDSANWTFAQLAAGQSVLITFEATVHAQTPEQRTALVNIAHVAASGDSSLANNFSTDTVYAVSKGTPPPPRKRIDVAISQISTADSISVVNGDSLKIVKAGETYSYQLKISNVGDSTASDVRLTNIFPDSVSVVGFSIAPQSVNQDSANWTFAQLAAGQSVLISFEATVRSTMPELRTALVNIAYVAANGDSSLVNNFSTDTVFAVSKGTPPPPRKRIDVSISQISTTDSTSVVNGDSLKIVKAGETYSYQLKVSNLGDSTASDVRLTNIFADSISVSNFSIAPSSVNQDSANWNFSQLNAGQSVLLSFEATVRSTMPEQHTALVNIAHVAASGDTSLANNFSADTVYAVSKGTPPPPRKRIDVAISQISTADSISVINGDTLKIVKAGETYSYQLKVSNVGDSTASDVRLTNIFPDSVSVAGFSIAPQSVNQDSANWTFAQLAAGQSVLISFEATVRSTMPELRTALVNIAYVAANGDSSLVNNFSTDTVFAVSKGTPPPPRKRIDVAISQISTTDSISVVNSDSLKIVKAGETYSYQLKISNVGDSTASDVRLTNIFADSISASGFSVAPQSVNQDSANWILAQLSAGQTVLINFEATVRSTMPELRTALVNIAHVAADGDSSLANNFSTDTVYAVSKGTPPPPRKRIDVAISQISTTDSISVINGDSLKIVKAGETYSYQLKISNVGDSTASDVRLTNIFPDSVSVAGFSIAPQSVNQDSANWTFAQLAAGQSVLISFEATVRSTMPELRTALVNIAYVAANGDSSLVNNFSTDTVFAVSKGTPPPPRKRIDVAISQISTTDSISVVNSDSLKIVKAGETYSYQLKISNVGDSTASDVRLTNIFPDSISAGGFSIAPQSVNQDSANWNFAQLNAGQTILINFETTVRSQMPGQRTALVNIAHVAANGDSSLANNFSTDTVFAVSKGTPPPPRKRIDVAISQISTTDSISVINGDSLKIVKAGETYSYQLKISNAGDSTASNVRLTNVFADSISADNFSIAPQSVNQDSANWNFAQLNAGQTVFINFEATVRSTMPEQRTALVNIAYVAANGDSSLVNNFSTDTVFAVSKGTPPPPRKRIDVAISQISTTDSISVVNSDSLKIVKAGETYSYQLKISNVGDSTASDVRLTNIFPDSISAGGFSIAPQSVNQDSANWTFAQLAAGQSVLISFEATVRSTMPELRTALVNIAYVAANGDSSLVNNFSTDTVFAVGRPPRPQVFPEIVTFPTEVQVGDSVQVAIRTHAQLVEWDVIVRFADGTSIDSYADAFIAQTTLQTETWYTLSPVFTETQLRTSARAEEIVFELHSRDVFGDRSVVQATVVVRSANAMVLDRNVFDPGFGQPLGINFKLSSNRIALLELVDITGRRVTKLTEQPFSAGWNTYNWDGRTENGELVGSGVYLVTIKSEDLQSWRKVVVVR